MPKREAVYTGMLKPNPRYPRRPRRLHALEHERDEHGVNWYRFRCQSVWMSDNSIEEYDYRYRGGAGIPPCRHQACSWAFNWELVG